MQGEEQVSLDATLKSQRTEIKQKVCVGKWELFLEGNEGKNGLKGCQLLLRAFTEHRV